MQINNFKILLDDKYISLNTNNEKEDLKSNEQLLSMRKIFRIKTKE